MKYLIKTIEYGLYLLVFLLPLQTRWIIKPGALNHGPWEYGTYSLYGTDVLLILLLFLFLVYTFLERRIKNYELRITNLIQNLFVVGLILASAVSVFFASSHRLALYKFGWLIMGVGLFWLITGANYSRLKLIFSLLAGVALQAGLGIWQFLSQTSFAYKWLGLAAHQASQLGTSVIETVGADGIGERWLRAYGGMDHPNILGGVLAIAILLLIGYIIIYEKGFGITNYLPTGQAGELRITDKIKNTKINSLDYFIFYFFLIVFTMALFFSFSRSAWLGLGLGLMILILGSIVKKDFSAQQALAKAVLIGGTVALVLFLTYSGLATARFNSGNRLEIKSTGERMESIKNSWPIIKSHWAGGVGLGNFTLALAREVKPGQPGYYYQPAHNVFILVFGETGILGLLFFLGLMICIIIFNFPPFGKLSGDKQFSIFKQFSINKFSKSKLEIRNCLSAGKAEKLEIVENNKAREAIINPSVLIAIIIIMCFDHWLFDLHFGVLFFWLVLGLTTRNTQHVTCNT